MILAGGGLALIGEKLLEIPIVLVGLAWMLLGYAVLVVKGATVPSTCTRKVNFVGHPLS